MQADIRGHLISVAAPVFLADMDHTNARLRLHVRRGVDIADVRVRAQAAIDAAGQPVEIVVQSHDLGQLAFPRSLEHWLGRFRLGDVIHDPTMIVTRARALLIAAKVCREAMGGQARGVFFDPARRTLLVLVRGGKGGASAATREWIRNLVDEAWARAADDGAIAAAPKVGVQAVVSLPRGDLVPVDAGSVSVGRRISTSIRRWLAPIMLMLAAGAIASPASARTDSRQSLFNAADSRVAGKGAGGETNYGVLGGLSVFADGPRHYEFDAFASSGLKMFFGNSVQRGQGVQLAQGHVRRAELSDTDSGTASGSPGS